jgi:RHS repeat-associated protein
MGTLAYAFTGREWDPEIGLYYYRARYYDPEVGRFVSEDPLEYLPGPQPYSYADGNPALELDPTGLSAATYGDPERCKELLREIERLLRDMIVRKIERLWPKYTLDAGGEKGS